MSYKLRNYQRRGVNILLNRFGGSGLLSDDMGLGKSLQAMHLQHRLDVKTLIVCPAPLKYNWMDEFKKFFPNKKLFICNGRTPTNKKIDSDIFICNYEILQYWRDYFIKKAKVELMILDESHYVKSSSSLRYKAAKAISKHTKYRILLSGTPIENRPAELWSQLQIINPKLFESWLLFVKKYNGARRDAFGWKLTKATNVEELHKKLLDTCMVRRKKEDVLTELPDKVRSVIPLEIDNRADYYSANKDIIAWLRKNTKLNLDKAKKAEAVIRLGKLKNISGLGKVKQIIKWVNETSPNEKLVVFCYNKNVLSELNKGIKNSVLVDSKVRGEERQKLVRKFQNDNRVRVFLTTIKIGGTGLTLHSASTTVFCQLAWSASSHNQAEDRTHRLGQEADVVNAIYFIAKDTIEEKIIKLIDSKRKDVSSIIDGETVEKTELLDELLKDFGK